MSRRTRWLVFVAAIAAACGSVDEGVLPPTTTALAEVTTTTSTSTTTPTSTTTTTSTTTSTTTTVPPRDIPSDSVWGEFRDLLTYWNVISEAGLTLDRPDIAPTIGVDDLEPVGDSGLGLFLDPVTDRSVFAGLVDLETEEVMAVVGVTDVFADEITGVVQVVWGGAYGLDDDGFTERIGGNVISMEQYESFGGDQGPFSYSFARRADLPFGADVYLLVVYDKTVLDGDADVLSPLLDAWARRATETADA